MVRHIIITISLLISSGVFAQLQYKIIPESLLINTNAVVRRYATDVKVYDINNIEIAENIAITVFEKEGLDHLMRFSVPYNDILKINIQNKVFDKNGKRAKKVEAIVVQENNYWKIQLVDKSKDLIYPLSVELEYKEKFNSYKVLSNWLPLIDYGVSIQNATLRLTVSDSSMVGFSSTHMLPPNSYFEEGNYVRLWELTNFYSIKKGSSTEPPLNSFPSVILKWKE